jgi:hypothetical protein
MKHAANVLGFLIGLGLAAPARAEFREVRQTIHGMT